MTITLVRQEIDDINTLPVSQGYLIYRSVRLARQSANGFWAVSSVLAIIFCNSTEMTVSGTFR